MILLGIALIILSMIFFFKAHGEWKKLRQLEATEPATVELLHSLDNSMDVGVGEGNLNFDTETTGRALCSKPLISELTQQPCVYYAMRVVQHYEEEYLERQQNGRTIRRTRRGVQEVIFNKRATPFTLKDNTGEIHVNPAGATFVPKMAYSQLVQADFANRITVGETVIQLPSHRRDHQRYIKGYEVEEELVPLNSTVYINGEASDSSGTLQLQRSDERGIFLISTKSEKELLKRGHSQINVYGIAGTVLFLAGIGVMIYL
ncbi:MAG: GIDE domain-containing protein [Calditrichia bacterium]